MNKVILFFISLTSWFYSFSQDHELKKEVIPGCTYSNPQIASIGLTEKQAKQKDIKLKIGKFPFLANGKSITVGDTEGIVKTIFNKETGELIGAHLIGSDVTELINSLSVAKSLETTEIELMKTVFVCYQSKHFLNF